VTGFLGPTVCSARRRRLGFARSSPAALFPLDLLAGMMAGIGLLLIFSAQSRIGGLRSRQSADRRHGRMADVATELDALLLCARASRRRWFYRSSCLSDWVSQASPSSKLQWALWVSCRQLAFEVIIENTAAACSGVMSVGKAPSELS
jgi:hypothetical protein